MKLFFKVKIGYDRDEYIRISNPKDLEKAFYLFMSKEDGFIASKPVRGVDIITIREDWNRALGVSDDWRLRGEDYSEIARKGIKRRYEGILEKYKNRVEYLIDNNKVGMIGTGIEIPKMGKKEYIGIESIKSI